MFCVGGPENVTNQNNFIPKQLSAEAPRVREQEEELNGNDPLATRLSSRLLQVFWLTAS